MQIHELCEPLTITVVFKIFRLSNPTTYLENAPAVMLGGQHFTLKDTPQKIIQSQQKINQISPTSLCIYFPKLVKHWTSLISEKIRSLS